MSLNRSLTTEEIRILTTQGNTAIPSWDTVKVGEGFDARKVHGCYFEGEVYIGALDGEPLQYDSMSLPVGLNGSYISDSKIGDNCAIYNVRCIKRYNIASNCFLFDIHELRCTPDASFGNARVTMNVMNEAGERVIKPFAAMLPSDAYLWAKYSDDVVLQQQLSLMTDKFAESQSHKRGEIGSHCVIKGTGSVRNTKIGSHCTIECASRISEMTILSSEDSPVEISENVILSDGIMGPKSKALHGAMAMSFVLGENTTIKLGARLMESVVGDNSTIACCESSNNIIFPAHEQHHNNSFLIASCIQGQSNVAAGATIGSNHNSRTCDGEILAGRGFWPGLCTSLKHSSRFASYTLISKGAYPAELDIRLPFCLVNNTEDALELMPAFWWLYNMYALARNNWKFSVRDRRKRKLQHIEFSTYAPDSMEEALYGYHFLKDLANLPAAQQVTELQNAVAQQVAQPQNTAIQQSDYSQNIAAQQTLEVPVAVNQQTSEDQAAIGQQITEPNISSDSQITAQHFSARPLSDDPIQISNGKTSSYKIENSSRPVRILKPKSAQIAYRQMLIHYLMINVLARPELDKVFSQGELDNNLSQSEFNNILSQRGFGFKTIDELFKTQGYCHNWVNLGGQLVREEDCDRLRTAIRNGEIDTWEAVHSYYDKLWSEYPEQKLLHAYSCVCRLFEVESLDANLWRQCIEEEKQTQTLIYERVLSSRAKDYANHWRKATYRCEEEMQAVVGRLEDDKFVAQMRSESEANIALLDKLLANL